MSLKVIGAGFGRTGTSSLKLALEQLGFGPCYHMSEVFGRPDHTQVWHEAALGKAIDWAGFFSAYGAVLDWPACYFWQEIRQASPGAKVLLTERDPESWYRSMSRTIFDLLARFRADPASNSRLQMASLIIEEMTFGGRTDREHAIAVYTAHNEAVKRAVPREELLVYDVSEGWEPLCAFLEVPVPSMPFPRVNTTEDFRARTPPN